MATLVTAREFPVPAPLHAVCLAEWLANDWALIFSHPQDFAHEGFECDRWQRIVRDAFRERGLRPLALVSPELHRQPQVGPPGDGSWITALSADASVLTLSSPGGDAASSALRESIGTLRGRYVLVIDSALQPQGVLRYVHSYMQSISPLDLLEPVDALRRRVGPAGGWDGPRRDYIPC